MLIAIRLPCIAQRIAYLAQLAGRRLTGRLSDRFIEDVEYEERTGAISFVARLSLGQLATGHASIEVYKFTGVLERN
jgi:hypothetical protein